MDNFERGDRALAAMRTYQGVGGSSDEEGVLGLYTDEDSDFHFLRGYPIGDLIADLLHLCARHDVDGPAMLAQGMEHFGADCVEQAWEHSDDWNDTMQHPENIERAINVLRMNNVPQSFWGGIMVKVGLVASDDESDFQAGLD